MVVRRSIVVEQLNDEYINKLKAEGYGKSYSGVVDNLIKERRLNEEICRNPN